MVAFDFGRRKASGKFHSSWHKTPATIKDKPRLSLNPWFLLATNVPWVKGHGKHDNVGILNNLTDVPY